VHRTILAEREVAGHRSRRAKPGKNPALYNRTVATIHSIPAISVARRHAIGSGTGFWASAVRVPGRAAVLWHLTSLDAPTVAVVWTLAFAHAAHVLLPLWVPCMLALGAWAVYIGDRLLDARSAHTPLRERHHFHWRHRRGFTALGVAAAVATLALIAACMPVAAMGRNAVLGGAAMVYFTGVHLRWFPDTSRDDRPGRRFPRLVSKELLVAVLFTLACVSPAWARMSTGRTTLLPAAACFVLLAWLNCHAIESWECGRDADGSAQAGSSIFRLGSALGIGCLIAAAINYRQAGSHDTPVAMLIACAAVSAALLAGLDRFASRLSPLTLRTAADLVLLTPLILLALNQAPI
jgi:hypothetical protein